LIEFVAKAFEPFVCVHQELNNPIEGFVYPRSIRMQIGSVASIVLNGPFRWTRFVFAGFAR
jgi:hypothetical protein